MDFGCATYCRFASQCLGTDMPPELLARRTDLLKDRVAAEVKKLLGRDFKRIGRTLRVVEFAGQIQKAEGGDHAVVILTALLQASAGACGRPEGDRERLSAEDLAVAESILSRTGAPDEPAREVISILNNLGDTDQKCDSINFKCVSDAILIAQLSESLKAAGSGKGAIRFYDDKALLTLTGRRIVEEIMAEYEGNHG
jgi:hypothetical protein